MVNTSMFLHVPQLHNVTVGQVAEFNWGYRLSDQDRNLVKAVQLSCPAYSHHKHRILWRNDSNGNQFTDREYTGRLLVSHEIKKKNYHHMKQCSFKLCNVTLQDERYYEMKIELGNTRKHLKSQVFLTVNGMTFHLCCLCCINCDPDQTTIIRHLQRRSWIIRRLNNIFLGSKKWCLAIWFQP